MWHSGLSVTALAGVAAVVQVHWPGSMANKKTNKHEKSTPKTLREPSLSKERGPNEKKKKERIGKY